MARMKNRGGGKVPSYNMGGGGNNPMQSMENAMGMMLLKQMMEQQSKTKKVGDLPPGTDLVEQAIDGGKYVTPEAGAVKAEQDRVTGSLKEIQKQGRAARSVTQTADTIGGALGVLADRYSEGYREGGLGHTFAAWGTKLAPHVGKNPLLGDWDEYYEQSQAFPGAINEVIVRMMPMLTKQGDKEGSVRLVKTIYERLMKTVPSMSTGPRGARTEMASTMRQMYGFAKAFQMQNKSMRELDAMSDAEYDAWVQGYESSSNQVLVSPTFAEDLEKTINVAMAPVDEIILEDKPAKMHWPPFKAIGWEGTPKGEDYSQQKIGPGLEARTPGYYDGQQQKIHIPGASIPASGAQSAPAGPLQQIGQQPTVPTQPGRSAFNMAAPQGATPQTVSAPDMFSGMGQGSVGGGVDMQPTEGVDAPDPMDELRELFMTP